MAEKRKLLNEIDKCFKKIDEGVELFEETMNKMHEANSDNQREKFQDDLKKEIKKLQRLRDQVKGWQNSSEIKDKEKLTHYRKVIEQRMEQFKDIERENKTKPHSKQGLSAEEKLDPREKEKHDTIEWLQNCIRELNDESDRTEMQMEALSNEGGKRRGKSKDDAKKNERERELKTHLDRMKFHIDQMEVCMRLVNNETLESKQVMEALKDPVELFLEALDPDYDGSSGEVEDLDPEDAYEELNLSSYSSALGVGHHVSGSVDDDRENGHHHHHDTSNGSHAGSQHHSVSHDDEVKSRHGSADGGTPASPAIAKKVSAAATVRMSSLETAVAGLSLSGGSAPATPPPVTPTAAAPVPPPPGLSYNSVAAGRKPATTAAAAAPAAPAAVPAAAVASPAPVAPPTPVAASTPSKPSPLATEKNDENRSPSVEKDAEVSRKEVVVVEAVALEAAKQSPPPQTPPTANSDEKERAVDGEIRKMDSPLLEASKETPAPADASSSSTTTEEEMRQVLRLSSQQQDQTRSRQPQSAHIPAWLGASPLGRAPATHEHDVHLAALEHALVHTPLQMDSERPRSYLPKMPCPTQSYYPQAPPAAADSLEYYLRLSPETLFFTFYYMEGSRAQLLAAKALKKLSWRFHTKFLMWFQRHEEPKMITDDYEEGTYVYFDFEKWSQRKKEKFTFEYRYLEDKDFD